MRLICISLFVFAAFFAKAQTVKDIFSSNDIQFSWLGIDYSHVKLIGDFSQYGGAGQKNAIQVRDTYFASWNQLVLNEPQKFDIKGMVNKDIYNDIDMVKALNAKTDPDKMEAANPPAYTSDDIKNFVKSYSVEDKKGIGIVFIAECLNKGLDEAFYHVVFISMPSKEVLLSEKILGKPAGVGLRNFWAGSVFNVIKKIKTEYYRSWKSKYSK